MKLLGPIAFIEIYGSNGAVSIRRRERLTFVPFLFARSKNRSDSLHEVPSLPFQDL